MPRPQPHATINIIFLGIGLKREHPNRAWQEQARFVPPSTARSDDDDDNDDHDDHDCGCGG